MSMDPIFIVGPPRSGTTLLQAMLVRAAGGALVTGPETHFFDLLLPQLRASQDQRIQQEILMKHCQTYFGADHGANVAQILAERVGFQAERELFACLLELWCGPTVASNGAPRLLEKTPAHLFALDPILSWFPSAHVVVLFRNPVRTIASQCAQSRFRFGGYGGVEYWVGRWAADVAAYNKRHDDPRVKMVRYEGLLRRPADLVKMLLSWCGVRAGDSEFTSAGNFILPWEHWKREAISAWPNRVSDTRKGSLLLKLTVWSRLAEEATSVGYMSPGRIPHRILAKFDREVDFAKLADRSIRRKLEVDDQSQSAAGDHASGDDIENVPTNTQSERPGIAPMNAPLQREAQDMPQGH